MHPKVLYDENGNKVGVLLKKKDFEKLIEELEDLHDMLIVHERANKKFKSIPYEQVKKELFGDNAKK